MHETVIAQQIISEAKKHGEVEEISLEIGELAHVPLHELIECFKRLVTWKVSHKEIPAKVSCICGYNGHPTILERGHDFFFIECPECKKIPKILEGTSITIVSVKVK